jgi:hypothetical protein
MSKYMKTKTTSDCNSYQELVEEFIVRDMITGRSKHHILNQKEVPKEEMDMMLNEWIWEYVNDGEV